MSGVWALMAGLWALGCTGGPPEDWESCSDAGCREAWAMASWAEAPDDVSARVAAMADPIEQQALVGAIAEAHPGETATLCKTLPPGAVRKHCDAINNRPHLRAKVAGGSGDGAGRTQMATGASLADRIAVGAPVAFMDQVDAVTFPDRWSGEAAVDSPCPTQPASRACVTAEAQRRAEVGEYNAIVGVCAGISDDKWRHECVFRAAEAPIQNPLIRMDSKRVRPSLELCMAAGPWVSRCFSHVISAIARRAPAATSPDTAPAWAALAQLVDTGRTTLSERADHAPHLAALFEDRAWAEATLRSYASAQHVTGLPLDTLPVVAHPHVRAAAAWRVMRDGGLDQRSLSAWYAQVATSLLDRATAPGATSVDLPQALRPLWIDADTAPLDGTPAAQVPWVHLLGNGSRATSPDPEVDLRIAVLEVAAQLNPTQRRAIKDGMKSDNPVVAWTATRIQRRLAATSKRTPGARP